MAPPDVPAVQADWPLRARQGPAEAAEAEALQPGLAREAAVAARPLPQRAAGEPGLPGPARAPAQAPLPEGRRPGGWPAAAGWRAGPAIVHRCNGHCRGPLTEPPRQPGAASAKSAAPDATAQSRDWAPVAPPLPPAVCGRAAESRPGGAPCPAAQNCSPPFADGRRAAAKAAAPVSDAVEPRGRTSRWRQTSPSLPTFRHSRSAERRLRRQGLDVAPAAQMTLA
jgi:hypothetical protein